MRGARTAIDLVADFWREIRRLIVVLWLCRISTLSAIGALALAFLPQVQDLYTEISYYTQPTTGDLITTAYFWGIFYALSFAWAFIVHYCARTVLSFESWPLTRADEYEYAYWIEAVPRFLGWACILSIFIGQINALTNLPIAAERANTAIWHSYITVLMVCFALIVFVQQITRHPGRFVTFMSIIASLFWLHSAYKTYTAMPVAHPNQAQLFHSLTLPMMTILMGVLFYWFVAKRRLLLNWLSRAVPFAHRSMLHVTIRLARFCPILIRPLHNAATRADAPKFFPFQKVSLFRFEGASENVRGLMLGLISLGIIIAVWCLFAIYDPSSPPFDLKRALLLPVLLGIWVPILSAITFVSNQIRFPLLTSIVGFGVIVSWLITDNHNVTLTNHAGIATQKLDTDLVAAPHGHPQKLSLKRALQIWMHHQNCEHDPEYCPPPIIISAAGGASRSAFFVATVLGEMHDNPHLFWPRTLNSRQRPLNPYKVSKRIFAISAVSGGSLGSALYTAALEANKNDQPCIGDALRRDQLLFSIPKSPLAKSRYQANWKNCLQGLAAGDFLSPTMIAHAFRDNLIFSSFIGLVMGEDRANALENAWRERTKLLTGADILHRPLLSFQPSRLHWQPLLLLNSTSVSTGRRVIATPLNATFNPKEKLRRLPLLTASTKPKKKRPVRAALFPDSLDLHDLIMTGAEQQIATIPDISLAKAVSLSARFPLVSPQANLRNPLGHITDRIVDGAYFDNSGMLTASELAEAIKEISNGVINPILIQISNQPVTLATTIKETNGKQTFKCPTEHFQTLKAAPREHQILPELTSVVGAMLNARSARGSHAIAKAKFKNPNSFVHFQVAAIADEFGTAKNLSMSWWLSKSVQNALNNQIKWRREVHVNKDTGTNKGETRTGLNPAFCAISDFRRAERQHWRSRRILRNESEPPYIGASQ